ncbi:hypothetical protein D3C81_1936450 [compost metagenome]
MKTGLRLGHHPCGIGFNLLLLLIFVHQRLHFAGRARHLIHCIDHRFVVIRDGQIALCLGDVEIRIEATAVEDRQRQSGSDPHLLGR